MTTPTECYIVTLSTDLLTGVRLLFLKLHEWMNKNKSTGVSNQWHRRYLLFVNLSVGLSAWGSFWRPRSASETSDITQKYIALPLYTQHMFNGHFPGDHGLVVALTQQHATDNAHWKSRL